MRFHFAYFWSRWLPSLGGDHMFFPGLKGETRSRASRRMCGSCPRCPIYPHLPSSTCGSAQPYSRRSWTKLYITWWKIAGELEILDQGCLDFLNRGPQTVGTMTKFTCTLNIAYFDVKRKTMGTNTMFKMKNESS